MTITVSPLTVLRGMVSIAGIGSKIDLYTAPQPASGGSVGGAVLLGTIIIDNQLGTITEDSTHWILTISDSVPGEAGESGVAAWCRLTDSSRDLFIADMDVGGVGSGASIIMPSTNVYQHGTISISSGVIKVQK